MMRKLFALKIKSGAGVWAFASVITLLAHVLSNRMVWYLFPNEIYDFTAIRACAITVFITFPTCLFVGSKIRENTMLGIELARLVNRDRLTDVATRDFFFKRMQTGPNSYGVSLMVDIDHFKNVNDTYGHYTGDAVIKHVGGILTDQCRSDDIVCRFGGEEFVIFLHEADGDKGLLIAERIRATIEATPVCADGSTIGVTVSIGGSLKERLEDINVSIKLADEALYRAKNMGRNRTVVDWLPTPAFERAKAS